MSEQGTADRDFTIPQGYIYAPACKELISFDRRISSGITDLDRDSNEAISYIGRLYDEVYEHVFQDVRLYRMAKDFTGTWTSWDRPKEFVDRVTESWQRVIRDQANEQYNDEFLYDLYSSRVERWQRLSNILGIDMPRGFRLFRGVHGEDHVLSALEQWLDDSRSDMRVLSYPLTSWSLSRAAGKDYSFNYYPHASVLFSANVQFANTLADKWVDDGSFILPHERECEVIVATPNNDEIVTSKIDVQVMFNNETYRFEDRYKLESALFR